MILGKVELLVMAILLSKNIAQCDDRATTARRDGRAAGGWAWTGRNLILDEALPTMDQLTAANCNDLFS